MKNRHGKTEIDMLEGSLGDKILFFALPLAAASILQQLFNSADLAVVGRFDSAAAMAAVGSNAPVINLIVSLFTGLSVGANVVIASMIGSGRQKECPRAVSTLFTMALLSGVALIFIGLLLARPILSLMGAPANVMNLASEYLEIYFLGMPFVMIYNFVSAILRARGDARRPLIALTIAGIANVFLNLFFVIVMDLSVAGVAIATDISGAISAAIVTWDLAHEEEDFHLNLRHLCLDHRYIVKTVKIGLPAGLQGAVFALSNVVIQTAINSFGANAIAGASAGSNFEFMCYFIINAFAQTAVTFTSQNFAAKKFDRCKRVLRWCWGLGTVLTLALSLVFWFGRGFFIRFFTEDPEVIQYAYVRMLFVSTLEIGTGLYEIPGGCLRGMGRSMTPAVLTILGSCVFRLIYINTIFLRFRSFETLFMIYPVSWLLTGAMVISAYYSARKHLFVM
ncbi:MATE family efflux transporter [Galactobacillus timonensis]|uniref:MATE family efflux transporter n=1 Tax=Galactobacillus timonensis TaxID=2041840 RepID=UPI00240A0C74|nr:MATE family efflux transporter [Galactobacillus timonensis]MDD6679663.1 MATE family efflux transporter [Galactobacillus timonensis]